MMPDAAGPLPKQGGGGPEGWSLSLEVAGYALSLHVVIVVVLFAGAFADAGYVLILVNAKDGIIDMVVHRDTRRRCSNGHQ
jgi:hypothetical protein